MHSALTVYFDKMHLYFSQFEINYFEKAKIGP